MKEARYFQVEDQGWVRCALCPHRCAIAPGKRGICGVRENREGILWALSYGRLVALNDDPIEKKPLFHVLPGSRSLSVATVGCNLTCAHCQNHEISQYPRRRAEIPGRDVSPQAVVDEALRLGSQTLSFTYSEPTIFMEWAQDIAERAVPAGVRCVSVTNGYTAPGPLSDLGKNLLAANVDLKGFREAFYRQVCGAQLKPVMETIALLRKLGVWVEVTTLLIPGLNDSEDELAELAAFLASVDRAMPWHLSRFHPDHEMLDRPPTSQDSIQRARRIGQEAGLRFVYSGNVWGDAGENTFCPACATPLIERCGFSVQAFRLKDGACPKCGERIEGIWS